MSKNNRIIIKVYRINTSLDVVSDHLTNEKRYREVSCKYDGYRLFVAAVQTQPKWESFLNSISSETHSLNNITGSFVLMRVTGRSSVYAVTGGYGTFAIQLFIDQDFGLDVLARLVDPDKVTLVRQQNISGNLLQEERVFKRPENYNTDPLGWLKIPRQILGEIGKADIRTELGLERDDRRPIRLDGRSGFSIRRSISFEELDLVMSNMQKVMEREPRIDLMKGCEEVSKEQRNVLFESFYKHLTKMFDTFLSGEDDFDDKSVIITSDDARQWLLCSEFRLNIGKKAFAREQLELGDLFAAFQEWEIGDIPDLSKVKIVGVDDEGRIHIQGNLNDFVMAEIRRNGHSYILIDRKWYRTTPDFTSYLDDIINRFLISNDEYILPKWPLKAEKLATEDDYIFNEISIVDNLEVFHRNHVHVASGSAEICDVFDTRDTEHKLVFIKKGISSKSRELARQAVDSILLLLNDVEFRHKAMDKMREKGIDIPSGDYPFDQCGVILAIVDEGMSESRVDRLLLERMRIIAKIEFAYALESLRSRVDGGVRLYEISKRANCDISSYTDDTELVTSP